MLNELELDVINDADTLQHCCQQGCHEQSKPRIGTLALYSQLKPRSHFALVGGHACYGPCRSSSSTSYKAGKVTAADESGSDVSILQSSEAGVEKTSNTQQQDEETDDTTQTAGSNTKQVNTKSAAESSGTSPVVVALIVLAVVGGIALAAIVYVVKKKKLDDKQIDRDEAMIRSFDTFSSPVEINATNIAKI
ncbi:hypothetical protein Pcac1_g4237 [Phytophthora cactorum]|nr:hypothetical protein Pcac1_g4237 [Phytophthora cactorum]